MLKTTIPSNKEITSKHQQIQARFSETYFEPFQHFPTPTFEAADMQGSTSSASIPSSSINFTRDTIPHYNSQSQKDTDKTSMSQAAPTATRVPMKKRKYSRGGCIECKRRKIKCDEGKPFCFNCTKVKKVCTYKPKKFTFEPVHTVEGPMMEIPTLKLDSDSSLVFGESFHQHHALEQPTAQGGLQNGYSFQNSSITLVNHQPSNTLPELQNQNIQQPTPPHPGILLPPPPPPLSAQSINQVAPPPPLSQEAQQQASGTEGHFYGYGQPTFLPQLHVLQNSPTGFPNAMPSYTPSLEHGVSQVSSTSSMAFLIPPVAMDPLFTEALELATDIGDLLNEESFGPILQTFDSTSSVTSLSADSIAQSLNNNTTSANDSGNQNNTDNNSNGHTFGLQDTSSSIRIASNTPIETHQDNATTKKGHHHSKKHKPKPVNVGNNALRDYIDEHKIAVVEYNCEPYSVPAQDALEDDTLRDLASFNVETFAKEVVADFSFRKSVPKYTWHPDLSLPNDTLIEGIAQLNPLFEKHLPYLKVLTNTPLSYHLYPFAESIESNEVLKILLTNLKHSPFLLASLLAMSATFQYNQSGAKIHEQLRFKYATLCLILLGDAFSQHIAKDNGANFEETVQKIENLVLTVLVLTSIFTAIAYSNKRNFLDNWKVHLRGAKDLLVNYLRLSKTHNIKHISFGMAVALVWFTAIEVIAVLTAPTGGVLREQSQIDEIFSLAGDFKAANNNNFHEAFIRLRLLTQTPKEFNTYLGHTASSFELIAEVCKEKSRSYEDRSILCRELSKMFASMETAKATTVIPLCKRETFIIPPESPLHPQNKTYSNYNISMAAYTEEIDGDGQSIFYSWFDAVELFHLDHVMMKILTMKGMMRLPRTHPLVQDMVRLILDSTFFIKYKSTDSYLRDKEADNILLETEKFYLPAKLFDVRCVMVQSPLLIAGICSFDEEQLERVEIFFMGCVKLGNGSSMAALHAISRHRERLKLSNNGFSQSDTTADTYLDGGLAEYLDADGEETIPFA